MRPLTEDQLFHVIDGFAFKCERFPEGTVRFELVGSQLREISLEQLKTLSFSGCYLVGREALPPLADAKREEISTPLLRQSRVVEVTALDELLRACQDLIRHASCVDHDVYALDKSARWMLYVSHHEELLLYEKTPNFERSAAP